MVRDDLRHVFEIAGVVSFSRDIHGVRIRNAIHAGLGDGDRHQQASRNLPAIFGIRDEFGTAYSILSQRGCGEGRSEEHTSELQSLMRISYAVFCLKKNKTHKDSQRAEAARTNT